MDGGILVCHGNFCLVQPMQLILVNPPSVSSAALTSKQNSDRLTCDFVPNLVEHQVCVSPVVGLPGKQKLCDRIGDIISK